MESEKLRIEEDPDYDTPDKRSRFFAVLLHKKAKSAESAKCPTVKIQINDEEKSEEERNGEKKKEKRSSLLDYRAILSRRMAVYEEAGKTPEPVSNPVEVGVVFQVPRSKIIINPFDFDVDSKKFIASKVKVVEKRVKALDTDVPMKNMLYEFFQPVKKPRSSWKTKMGV